MAETLAKLSPNRDLQCYFQEPTAVAALSETSPTGFVLSGCWRQQFDWAVLEWNRDNVHEHPAFRNLPDGDLSGLTLTYDETRTNCIPLDSDLWPTVEWPYLRIWPEGRALPQLVELTKCAAAIEGTLAPASAEIELQGTPTTGDYIGLAWLTEQYNHVVTATDTIESATAALANEINSFTTAAMSASASGGQLTLTLKTPGANGNRVGVYGYVSGARTEFWSPWWKICSGGTSSTKWRIHIDFDHLSDKDTKDPIDVSAVRKMRWTYSAGWQNDVFQRSEFQVQVSNWTVTGSRAYSVAGPGSQRIEDDAPDITYPIVSAWTAVKGAYNYSSGSYHLTRTKDAKLVSTYHAFGSHSLYLGTQRVGDGAQISVTVDGNNVQVPDLCLPGEDPWVRLPLGTYGPGVHTVSVQHAGPDGNAFYFDFLELAVPTTTLPVTTPDTKLSLATDWDTEHSLSLAPERTAWMIDTLGFHGRVNHYVGAMWFYELTAVGHQYASAQVTFTGDPSSVPLSQISIARTEAPDEPTIITHLHYKGDTPETIAKAFEMAINWGSSSIRATSQGGTLTVYSRTMGLDGTHVLISATPGSGPFIAQASDTHLDGGIDGDWRTDLAANPRLNRAVRDWTRSYFAALNSRGLDGVAALSMELRHGDPAPEAGIAQRCPAGDAVVVTTPALQTNFSPTSIAFWQQAYQDLAGTMAAAGMQPYLQFGEVQWWYNRDARSGMPFYDEYAKAAFKTAYGRDMRNITDNSAAPAAYPEEVQFLPTLIGQFTRQIMAYVRTQYPTCRFEVLYPLDVNDTDLNRAVNYPAADWTPATLDCLKTESFNYTYSRDLNKCRTSILLPETRGFPTTKSAHLTGISDPMSPWIKEVGMARAEGLESTVLFALDQFCLVGYPVPLPASSRRSTYQG